MKVRWLTLMSDKLKNDKPGTGLPYKDEKKRSTLKSLDLLWSTVFITANQQGVGRVQQMMAD